MTGSISSFDAWAYVAYMALHFDAAWQELGYDQMEVIRAHEVGSMSDSEYEGLVDQAYVRAQEIGEGNPCNNQGVSPLDGSKGDFPHIDAGT